MPVYAKLRGKKAWTVRVGLANGGTMDHRKLLNTDKEGQHPLSAITGLPEALEGRAPAVHTHTFSAADVGARPNTWTPSAADVGAAPTGYGLGGNCASIDSVLNINKNGWFVSNVDTPNGNWWMCHALCANNGDRVEVMAYSVTGNYRARRSKNTTWDEWEWIDPPMIVGIEYRTTERWEGKAVYAQAFSFGSLPNSYAASISHGAAITRVLRAYGTDSYGGVLPRTNATISAGANSIVITTTADNSSRTAVIALWYTKD